MAGRRFALYFAWNRTAEIDADLGQLDNRYPALFEFRRMLRPEFERLADPGKFAQGIQGFIDDVILSDFQFFRRHIEAETGNPVGVVQRRAGDVETPLGAVCSGGNDTLIVVSLDHQRTGQTASPDEITAAREFLANSRHTLRKDRRIAVMAEFDLLRSEPLVGRKAGDAAVQQRRPLAARKASAPHSKTATASTLSVGCVCAGHMEQDLAGARKREAGFKNEWGRAPFSPPPKFPTRRI
jgi:hypothetical protein